MDGSWPRTRRATLAYWGIAIGSVGFGYLTLFSIGAPFLLMGTAMMVVAPWRDRPQILWPAMAAVWLFVFGYLLVAPVSCSTTSIATAIAASAPRSSTTCTSALGIDYSATGASNPSLLPAFLAGIALAAMGALLTRFLLTRGGRLPA